MAVYSASSSLATVSLPGGGEAYYTSGALTAVRHKDWLGSSRLATTWAHAIYSKTAYAPFGETYNTAGTSDQDFTGKTQDSVATLTDFPYRKFDSNAGRWTAPDPGAWSVVDPTNPQSYNRYAYVLNSPLKWIDPMGLGICYYGPVGGESTDGDPSDWDTTNEGGSDCQGGTYYDVSDTVNVNADGSGSDVEVDSGTSSEDSLDFGTITISTSWVSPSGAPSNCISPGVCNSPIDNHLNLMEKGKTSYRDAFPICSLHVPVDNATGSANPHLDLFSPTASLPTGPVTGNIPLLPFHLLFDALPDAIYRVTGHYLLPAGRGLCQ